MNLSDYRTCHELMDAYYVDKIINVSDIMQYFTKQRRQQCDWDMLFSKMHVFVILLVTMVIGIIGNIHLIIVYAHCYKKNNFRLYVLVLSVIDLLGCCISIPLQLLYSFRYLTIYTQSALLCKLFDITHTIYVASITILAIIGIDRLRRTTKPLGKQLTYTHAKIACCMCCITSCVLNIPSLIVFRHDI